MNPISVQLLLVGLVIVLLVVLVAGFLAFRSILRTEAYLIELFARIARYEVRLAERKEARG